MTCCSFFLVSCYLCYMILQNNNLLWWIAKQLMYKTFNTTAYFRHIQISRISIWISTVVSQMLQCMLGTTSTVQNSPMTPSMNKLCHWFVHLFSLIISMCFYFCWVILACFVKFRVVFIMVDSHNCWDSWFVRCVFQRILKLFLLLSVKIKKKFITARALFSSSVLI